MTRWVELTDVDPPVVGFRWTWEFAADGAVLTSDSTLRFRDRDEVERDLTAAGWELVEVRVRPTGPGSNSWSSPAGSDRYRRLDASPPPRSMRRWRYQENQPR